MMMHEMGYLQLVCICNFNEKDLNETCFRRDMDQDWKSSKDRQIFLA